MSEPRTGSASPAGRTEDPSDSAPSTELSWADTARMVPVVLRTGVLAGQRLADWAVSPFLVTRSTNGTADTTADAPAVGLFGVFGLVRDGVLGGLRDALGVTEIEAELRRIRGHSTVMSPPNALDAGSSRGPRSIGSSSGSSGSAPSGGPPSTDSGPTGSPSAPAESSPAPSAVRSPAPAAEPEPVPESLRERGRRLLAQSAMLEADEEHPAFGMVLEQVAPDEMRLLRVLMRDGAQPVIDVEAAGVLGGGARTVARRLSLLAENAGAKHPDRLPVYLDNLERLGVLRVGDEEIDGADYEVVEAQPRVDEARREASQGASRARLVRRHLALTDFGASFCRACLPAS